MAHGLKEKGKGKRKGKIREDKLRTER